MSNFKLKQNGEQVQKAIDYAMQVPQLSEAIAKKVSKTGITLERHTDGLIYIFVDGVPVGNGVELGTVVEGDVIGTLDERNNLLLSGNLADGTYVLKWLNSDGTYSYVGTMEVGAIIQELTNLFVIGGNGYITNGRCSSTGEDRTSNNGYIVTNYIDIKNGDTVYIKNATVKNDTKCYSGIKLTDGATIGLYPNNSEYVTNYSESNGITQFTINKADADYIRITLEIYTDGKSATEERVSELGIIITVNEPLS